MIAFHGEASVKAGILDRLDAAQDAGRLAHFVPKEPNGSVTLLQCVAPSGAAADAASVAGYPESILLLWQTLGQSLFHARGSKCFYTVSRRFISETPVAAELGDVPTRMIVWMLQHPEVAGPAQGLGEHLLDLHRRDIGGDPPARAEWAQLRIRAMTAVDETGGDKSAPPRFWEVAAWSARSSRSVLGAAASAWIALTVEKPDTGWTPADEARMKAIFEGLSADRAAPGATDKRPMPAIFAEREPDLSARFDRHFAATNLAYNERALPLADAAIGFLALARVALPAE